MEVEEMYAEEGEEEKMDVEDNNLNNSNVFSVQDTCVTVVTLLSSVR